MPDTPRLDPELVSELVAKAHGDLARMGRAAAAAAQRWSDAA